MNPKPRPRGARALLALALLLLLPALAPAQPMPIPAGSPEPELQVFLLTMGQGDLFYEKFGHNAIWIRDRVAGTDLVYNYGTFDFDQENYLLRLIQGRMLYWLDVGELDRTLYAYQYFNRSVWAQELNLTEEQKRRVQEFLRWNARPENREYVYDYYRDNCSTRLRDLIDEALGGQLEAATDTILVPRTYRSHTLRLTADVAGAHPGLLLSLADRADVPLTRWEEMFLPMQLREVVQGFRVRRPDGSVVPLVLREATLYDARRDPPRADPPGWFGWYLATGLALAAALVGLGRAAPRSRAARWGFAALAALWALLAGTAGVMLAGLWTVTDHVIAYGNENLMQASPLALLLVLLVPAAVYGARWARRPARWIALAVAALSVLGFVLQALPAWDQYNAGILAVALPVNLALAWAVWRLPPRPAAPAPEPAR